VTQFAFIAFCNILPGVLLSPLAGALVDRWSHRWTMLLGDTGAVLSTLAIAALLLGGQLEVWHIYV
jgi:DHA3 family macrolide efflux protein-like MFS transporter